MMSVCLNNFSKIWLKFLFAAGAFSLFAISISISWERFDIAAALVPGFIAGIGDNCIMLGGVEKGAKLPWAKAFVLMKKNMLMRVAFAGIICLLAIKSKVSMVWFFAAFCLLHPMCLVFIIITARGWEKIPECRKE